ncbi:putative mitochondrial kinteoplast poly(A) polymerase complex 1 subunit [Leptomonas pyrrhocoris]|uniref:Putative mitochondrial kinteoplast poly(A) polymerase complex 1 subunit n=1 Tax=Leptomonas pyrrhocoris TaxID=157538 RepID=A0A0N0VH80_LEPPY|nr:putative mitochondrial kinteoplast poly(A) polymerase complex 1 subunit [Leptomonas pyrrhocoris]KPA84874.1 putative mitochondrial kinteoplast poly(A) polymerase complex 1 subunit [Leptomonas pyrrhocoris]|eukprot:XP_015663313.1 putative mitochondrial kinteoplast poly(A) polymerase complex 1 subunit [Leptomonas pyrrhocoris]
MLRRCGAALAAKKLPNPGSSLLNPRSHRAKLRRAAALSAQSEAQFESQAMFAKVGGSGEGGTDTPSPARAFKSRKQRRGHHVRSVVGRDVAERAKAMTDAEWESVPMEDKHAFTKYMSEVLRERPTEATEQQRRRYFETTMMDPRDLDPNRTVQDEYERLKLGLPVQLKDPQRSLGVSQAIFESGDAGLFHPENVDRLEEAMVQIKQVFADYTRQRREGVSTEAARRKLSNMLAELNVETQRHLSHMFKYAEERVRQAAREERTRQLRELHRLRQLVLSPPKSSSSSSSSSATAVASPSSSSSFQQNGEARADTAGGQEQQSMTGVDSSSPSASSAPSPATLATTKKRALLKKSLGKALGMELDVVETLITELEAQEKFMQFCEVFARLTVAHGFQHGPEDEGLDAYAESLRRLYSVDANKLSTLDVVQYLAAKEEAHPVDWAKRWYERLVRLPLELTPEFRRLEEIREGDKAALELQAAAAKEGQAGVSASGGHDAAKQAGQTAAAGRTQDAVRLVEKMFMRPDDPRLKSLHEKRLRYIAYLQMERQIAQARENAKLFEGVEDTAEAEECRRLYAQLMEHKAKRTGVTPAARGEASSSTTALSDNATGEEINVFAQDPEAAALFEQISQITQSVIRTCVKDARRRSKAAAKAEVLAKVVRHVKGVAATAADGSAADATGGGDGGAPRAGALRQLLREKKDKVAQRLLNVLEADVKSDMEWLDAMDDAERPPLLPIPEGMSYVSAADVQAWKEVRDADNALSADPFRKSKKQFQPKLFGQPWQMPDKPLLFWGTGTRAVQQALEQAAGDAERRRRGEPLAPPYPCPENPWGWRLVKDILDD